MSSATTKMTTGSFYLLVIAIVPVFFLPSALDVFNTPKVWVLLSLSLTICAHSFLTARNVNDIAKGEARSSLSHYALISVWLLIGGTLLTSFVSDTTTSRIMWGMPGRANGLLYFFSVFALILVGYRMNMKANFDSRLLLAIQFPILINCAYGLIQFLGLDPVPWTNPYSPIIGTFGNPNFSAAFLAIGAVFNLWLVLKATSGIYRILYLGIAILSGTLSVLTRSIQGPLIIGIGITLMCLRFIYWKLSKIRFILALSFVGLSSGGIFLSFLGLGPLGDRLEQYTLVLRLEYWKLAIRMASENPLIGQGTDSYIEGFRKYRTLDFVKQYSQSLNADSAHSAPLNFLANFGFVNFGLYMFLILAISIASLKLFFSKDRHELSALLGLIWMLTFIQSLFSLEQVGLGAFQWAIGGLVISHSVNNLLLEQRVNNVPHKKPGVLSRKPTKESLKVEFASELALGVFLISIFLSSSVIRSDMFLLSLRTGTAQERFDADEIEKKIQSQSFLSQDEVRRAIYISDYYTNQKNLSRSLEVLQRITAKDPQAYEALNQLARIANFQGEFGKEIDYRTRISKLDPQNQENLLSLADAFKLSGRVSESISTLESMLLSWPDSPQAESASVLLSELKK